MDPEATEKKQAWEFFPREQNQGLIREMPPPFRSGTFKRVPRRILQCFLFFHSLNGSYCCFLASLATIVNLFCMED